PGAVVIEAGLGSGSLTSALLRAVGPTGKIITYEINDTTIDKALQNIAKVIPDTSNLSITVGDIYAGINESDVDRVVLDVPEPWQAVETLLRPWHVSGRSVRPDHRMVAHSGFLTTSVRCEPKSKPPDTADASDSDL
ncbi:MAG: tRNA (adenine-N1)-methyltransferase, partial [SAR202 cluster bacterium]